VACGVGGGGLSWCGCRLRGSLCITVCVHVFIAPTSLFLTYTVSCPHIIPFAFASLCNRIVVIDEWVGGWLSRTPPLVMRVCNRWGTLSHPAALSTTAVPCTGLSDLLSGVGISNCALFRLTKSSSLSRQLNRVVCGLASQQCAHTCGWVDGRAARLPRVCQ
jgi:hypothetical protein